MRDDEFMPTVDRRLSMVTRSGTAANVVPKPVVREVWLALLPEVRIELLPASLQFGRPVLEPNRMFLERDWVGTLRRHTGAAAAIFVSVRGPRSRGSRDWRQCR